MKIKTSDRIGSSRLSLPLALAFLVIVVVFCPVQTRTETAATTLASSSAKPQPRPTRVSGPSPFPAGCSISPDPDEIYYQNAEVESWVAADPTNPNHLIGAWQQDRWQFGGARGLMTAVSWDGGFTWSRTFAHFSRCTGGTAANGGDYERASDPWVTISPSGAAFQTALVFNQFNNSANAVLVSRSFDGGAHWSEPVALIVDTDPLVLNDKETITADPTNWRFVYAVLGPQRFRQRW